MLPAAPAHGGPAPVTGGPRPSVHTRVPHPASTAAWNDDWSGTFSRQDTAALDALSRRLHALDAPTKTQDRSRNIRATLGIARTLRMSRARWMRSSTCTVKRSCCMTWSLSSSMPT